MAINKGGSTGCNIDCATIQVDVAPLFSLMMLIIITQCIVELERNKIIVIVHRIQIDDTSKVRSHKEQRHLNLSTETVEGTARALECVDDVECSDSLALRVFCVGDRVADDREGG